MQPGEMGGQMSSEVMSSAAGAGKGALPILGTCWLRRRMER